MEIIFPYERIRPVTVPDKNLIGVLRPKHVPRLLSEQELVKRSLESPLGCRALAEEVRGKKRILLVVEDNTRSAPLEGLFSILLNHVAEVGVTRKNIKLLVASGTHRPMNQEEKENKFGRMICSGLEVLDHDAYDGEKLLFMGRTEQGIEIWINKEIADSDFVIGVGSVVPHRVAGFSGGGKIIQPGVSGELTTGQTHWLSAQYPGEAIMGTVENKVRQEIDAVARKTNLAFIVNLVLDREGRVAEVVSGNLEKAHRRGCEISRNIFGVPVKEKTDIVITDSYPADLELWQAAKGIYAADLLVREGGVVILVTSCPEGVSVRHSQILEHGYLSYEDTKSLVESGQLTDLTVAAHLVHVGRVIREKACAIMVSPGISATQKEKLGFMHASTPQEALEMAFKLRGRGAKVAVMKHGGDILPLVGEVRDR